MKIITWNINSVRLRLPLLLKLIEEQAPDVICLQETKCPDDLFPLEEVKTYGYINTHIWGQKSYNGQAILSKHPLTELRTYKRCGLDDCRHISAKIADFTLHNLYVPSGGSGGDEPDLESNPKFLHKLAFVDEMAYWWSDQYNKDAPMIVCGDFNIAPYEHDVWSHKQLLKVISHTPEETSRLEVMRTSLEWIDTRVHFTNMDEKAYTWWSYRSKDWTKHNRGRRLDHIWVTSPLIDRLRDFTILTNYRSAEKPSDHVPVVLQMDAT